MALLAPGTQLSRYVVQEKLATGGMAEVYLAKQRGPAGFAKQVVLKVLLPHLAADRELVRMFHNEAKLAARLNHPGIVEIYDLGVEGATHFISMEHVDGVNLRRIVSRLAARRRRMRRQLALRIVIDACRALHYAHNLADPGGRQLEIIHRDVSLENILVSYSGQVKLVDFGIAKARTMESYTRTGVLKGKYEYLPPEVLEGEQLDHRVDVYALGVVLYLLLLGRAPFVGHNEAQLIDRILVDPPPVPREVDPGLPKQLERIVLKALRKDRNRRYQSARQLAYDLNMELEREGPPTVETSLGSFVLRLFPPDTDPSATVPTPEDHASPLDLTREASISGILERAPRVDSDAPTEPVVPGSPPSFDGPDTVPDSPSKMKDLEDLEVEPDLPTAPMALPPGLSAERSPLTDQRTEEMAAPSLTADELETAPIPLIDPAALPTEPMPPVDPADLPTDPLPPGVDPSMPPTTPFPTGEDPEKR
jgi:serine/threonine-protein kinase